MEFVFGMLAALGILALLVILAGFLLLPVISSDGARIIVTLYMGESLHLSCGLLRGLVFLREIGLVWWEIAVIVSPEVDSENNILTLLCAQYHGVYVLTEEAYLDWVKQTNGK